MKGDQAGARTTAGLALQLGWARMGAETPKRSSGPRAVGIAPRVSQERRILVNALGPQKEEKTLSPKLQFRAAGRQREAGLFSSHGKRRAQTGRKSEVCIFHVKIKFQNGK